jgi:hypothetical protein
MPRPRRRIPRANEASVWGASLHLRPRPNHFLIILVFHFIIFICVPSLSAVLAVIVITVTVLLIVTTVLFITTTVLIMAVTVLIMAVTVVGTTWTPNQSHCNDQHYNH